MSVVKVIGDHIISYYVHGYYGQRYISKPHTSQCPQSLGSILVQIDVFCTTPNEFIINDTTK